MGRRMACGEGGCRLWRSVVVSFLRGGGVGKKSVDGRGRGRRAGVRRQGALFVVWKRTSDGGGGGELEVTKRYQKA